jgi:glycosyltransferase involved in cell wall biosynthesis
MKDKNILIITSWSYNDALIQTYTLPYVEIISKNLSDSSKIFLVTLEKDNKKIEIKYCKIHHLPVPYHSFGLKGILMWIKLYLKLKKAVRKEKIQYIHAWCSPAGMIGYLLSVFTSRKLIIDSYEPHAESMIENGTWKKSSLAYVMLNFFEKRIAKNANVLISTTKSFMDYSIKKYKLDKNKFYVKPACVDLNLFSDKNIKYKKLLENLDLEDKIVCVYSGKFGGIYLGQEVFNLIKIAENFWGDKFRFLLLTSHSDNEIETYRKKSNIDIKTIIKQFVPFKDIPNYIGLGDFALTPVKPVPSKLFCTPIKNGEYWALGLPIIITKNISDDSDIISENEIGYVLKDLSNDEYLNAVIKIDSIIKGNSRIEVYNKIRPIAEKYRNFKISESIYSEIYIS